MNALQLTTPNAQSADHDNNHNTLTLNAHNQHFDTPQLHIPTPTSILSAPGPSNWPPLQPMTPGYIAHNPPYHYNVNTYYPTHWP